jgi:autotransporter-associated beta strand protein
MDISGTGSLRISGAGEVTLIGDNSYTGATSITSGSKLVAGSDTALGSNPQIITNGGYFGTSAGVELPSLSATGGVIKLTSDITTAGTQTYEDIVLAKSSTANTLSLASTNSDITISGTINDSVAKTSSMVIDAGTADVILGDSIGNVARFDSLTVTGENIYILADILTGTTQTYNGNIRIGSGTYIGKQFVEGFLFATHNQYFRYGTGTAASSYDYKNNDPRYVRTLISEDPMITFNGTVDDVAEYTHTLLVAAIAPNISSAISLPPTINFEQPVSTILPLYSLNAQAIVRDTAVTCNVCEINLVGGVKTFGSQTYRAGIMNASATSPGGDVTFSVFDPNASVNYILPLQTNGQINLRNPGSTDGLLINGNNNFTSTANLTGDDNWGTRFREAAALGATATVAGNNFDLMKLKQQSELAKEENLVVGEVTIDELEEESVDCARPQTDMPLDPNCRFDTNI